MTAINRAETEAWATYERHRRAAVAAKEWRARQAEFAARADEHAAALVEQAVYMATIAEQEREQARQDYERIYLSIKRMERDPVLLAAYEGNSWE